MKPPTFSAQGSAEWHQERAGKVTASIAAAALGLHPYMSRQEAYRRVLGIHKDRDNAWMQYGREHEGRACLDYEIETGRLVNVTGFHVHPEHPWIGASPDGLVGADGLLEIKCLSTLPTAIALHHRIQCLVQLAVTGRKWCDFFVWQDGGHFLQRVYAAGLAGLIRRLEAFYRDYCLTKTEPPRKRRRKLERKTV